MSDLFQDKQLPEFSVTELSQSIKLTVEETFSYVRVRGEISGFKRAPSGHLYLSLKDDKSVLSAVCWRGTSELFAIQPEDGMEVICTGKITTFAGQSKYQLVINFMDIAGQGALMALLEKRKKQLAAEGLFDIERKKPLPFMPKKIGVVTSPTGAVIRDIIHRIEDRFPCHILLHPVLVQGDQAAGQIVNAIAEFDKMNDKPDVLIIGRGGGSLEDLWAFNEEEVVRAIAACSIPIISAVGHETDTTLADFVADLRAPTPTAAAEMATPIKSELILLIGELKTRCKSAIIRYIEDKDKFLKMLARTLPKPTSVIDEKTQRLDNLTMRLQNILPSVLEKKQRDLMFLSKMLESLNYKKVLSRGFSLVKNDKGKLVTSAASIANGDILDVEFSDGHKQVVAGGAKPKKSTKIVAKQESLF